MTPVQFVTWHCSWNVPVFAEGLGKGLCAAQAQAQFQTFVGAGGGMDVQCLLRGLPMCVRGRALINACAVQLSLQVKVPFGPFVKWAGSLRAEVAGPGEQLRHFAQQGACVAGCWLGQRVPADHTLGVFAAVEFQILQVHGVDFIQSCHCRWAGHLSLGIHKLTILLKF